MRVVIDARPLSHPQAGGYRSYLRALVFGLAARKGDEEVLLYLDRPVASGVLPPQFATRILSPSRIKTDLQLFQQQVRRDRPDVVMGTVNYLPLGIKTPTVLTLHDALLLKRYPWEGKVQRTFRQRVLNAYWAALCRISVSRATKLLTISHGSAAELSSALARPISQFSVVHNGVFLERPQNAVVREKNVVLAIAAPDARKNIGAVLTAFSHLQQSNTELRLICTSLQTAISMEQEVSARRLSNVVLLRSLSDAALYENYARATVFAWPSRFEGFGLPPLEAMLLGCPVVSSNAVPMPEILGDAALFFDPDDPMQLAAHLKSLLADPVAQKKYQEIGQLQAAKYTIEAMAQGTAAIWKEALS